MPTISQLVRKGREEIRKKSSTLLSRVARRSAGCVSGSIRPPLRNQLALRMIARERLTNGIEVTSYIPESVIICRNTRWS